MRSGRGLGLANTFGLAFSRLRKLHGTSARFGNRFISVADRTNHLPDIATNLSSDIKIKATEGTYKFLTERALNASMLKSCLKKTKYCGQHYER